MKNSTPFYIYYQGAVMLPIELAPIEPEITFRGKKFVVKDEFHVTLLWLPVLLQKLGAKGEKAEEEVFKTILKIFHRVEVSFGRFLDDIRLAEYKDAKTIVIMCEVRGIEEFFSKLRKTLGIKIPSPTPHITLYTLENKMPIGINNQEELSARTKRLTGKELEIVKKATNLI